MTPLPAQLNASALPVDWTHSGVPVVIGSGLAGLMTALELAPHPCVLVTAGGMPGDCASSWAQGGLAAAVGPDDDSEIHIADTIAAGAGLCEPDVVRRIVQAGPDAVTRLVALGARLDRNQDGTLRLGLEGAHSRNRIVHAAGDATGAELVRAAVAAVRATPSITVLTQTLVRSLVTDPDTGRLCGLVVGDGPDARTLRTDRAVLATGGIGALFAHTTNPRGSWGSGLALGLRAGAVARDLEMVQFHPTALDVGLDPMPLISEAVRGEGAVLVTRSGRPIMEDCLAPRDVVARVVWSTLESGEQVYLDATRAPGRRFAVRFPGITATCRAAGLDPLSEPLPIRPAAHYHMGGLVVDGHGRTTVPGVWAVGEVASTGLHGANRLASNSLLEGVVCSRWVAESVRRTTEPAVPAAATDGGVGVPARAARRFGRVPVPDVAGSDSVRDLDVRTELSTAAGVIREHATLAKAVDRLRPAADRDDAALVALMICWSAMSRSESRGAHTRADHPARSPRSHTLVTAEDVLSEIDGHRLSERSA